MRNTESQYNLSFSQEQLWFLNQLSPNDSTYNIANILKIQGPLNKSILKKCFFTLMERHEALRTFFCTVSSQPMQCVYNMNACGEVFVEEDYSDIEYQLHDHSIQSSVLKKINQPFNLATDILFKIFLYHFAHDNYLLVFVVHHIICDGWSLNVLFKEMIQLYEAYSTDRLPLIEQQARYSDFCVRQRENISSENFTSGVAYWQKKLQAAPSNLQLPVDYPVKNMTSAGKQIVFHLPKELQQAIQHCAKQFRVSSFIVTLAALYVFLYRYTLQSDIVVGIPTANRNDPKYHHVVGLFVNILPNLLHITSQDSFTTIIEKLKQTVAESIRYQDIPFEQIVQAARHSRSSEHTPLFQVFAVQTIANATMKMHDLTLQTILLHNNTAKYPLSFYFEELPDNYQITLEYATDLFADQTAKNMLFLLAENIQGLLASPHQEIQNLSFSITNQESVAPVIDERCCHISIIELFNQQVKLYPHKIALYYKNDVITFSELDSYSTQIALMLEEKCVTKSSVVAIAMKRCIDRIACIIAVLKLNAIFLSLDPDLPKERLENFVHQAHATCILSLSMDFGFSDVPSFKIDKSLLGTITHELQMRSPEATDVAYIIFTSGTTSISKGVLATHQGILNRVHWAWEKYPFKENDKCCHQTSVMFVDAIAEIFVPLLQGVPAVIVPESIFLDPRLFVSLLSKERITRILLIPSVLRLIINAVTVLNEPLYYLRLWMVSGEPLDRSLCESFFNFFKDKILINIYGSSEVAADATYFEMQETPTSHSVPIGKPLSNTRIYILDQHYLPVPPGMPGEIFISGMGVAAGYLGVSDEEQKFLPDPLVEKRKMYRSGDFGRYGHDGLLYFIGRKDRQIKINGRRVELGEIETNVSLHQDVRDAVVTVDSVNELVCYLVKDSTSNLTVPALRYFLSQRLPNYMIPQKYYQINKIPRTITGKLDRNALENLAVERLDDIEETIIYEGVQEKIARIWSLVLNKETIGINSNFFDLGGHSLLLVKLREILETELGREITIAQLAEYPTIKSFSNFVSKIETTTDQDIEEKSVKTNCDIAIIGMAGRFPDANNVNEFWQNLFSERCSIRDFQDQEIPDAIKSQLETSDDLWIKKGGIIEDIEYFDADFFGFKPIEAELLDPQQRLFLENAWEALEHAGYNPDNYPGTIGVFASTAASTYFIAYLLHRLSFTDPMGIFSAIISNNENYLATRVAYKLNLKGPSLSILSACSSSLAAVHMACRCLQVGDADIMLAGGVSIKVPQTTGYIYQEGSLVSEDGKCMAFDHKANGTIFANGSGIVVLKRVEDALRDKDNIYAVIKGSAINNDGREKIGYIAPSIKGQACVLRQALIDAQVDSNSVSYIETHGTGTPLGDPIELAALQQVYRFAEKQSCAIGSVKTNIGHLDAAAGIASLIKVALSLKNGYLPASLHFEQGNSEFDWENGSFFVNNKTTEWKKKGCRRAGVSSFGIGGTNAHVILEEAPKRDVNLEDGPSLFVLSALCPNALSMMKSNLAKHIEQSSDSLADMAFTLQMGRKELPHRWSCVATTSQEAISALSQQDEFINTSNFFSAKIFLISTQYINADLTIALYHSLPSYRELIHAGLEILSSYLQQHNISVSNLAKDLFNQPLWLQDSLSFIATYALTQLWIKIGVHPVALVSYGLNELLAACIANVITFDVALKIIYLRCLLNNPEIRCSNIQNELEHILDNMTLKRALIPLTTCTHDTWFNHQQLKNCTIWLESMQSTSVSLAFFEKIMCQYSQALLIKIGSQCDLDYLINSTQLTNQQRLISVANDKDIYCAWLCSLGLCWNFGCQINWQEVFKGKVAYRVELPTYPFQRKRFWPEEPGNLFTESQNQHIEPKKTDINLGENELNELELKLTELFEKYLGIIDPDVNKDFFELGGDSLLATQMVASINRLLPVQMPLSEFFNHATVKKLTRYLKELLIEKINAMTDDEIVEVLI